MASTIAAAASSFLGISAAKVYKYVGGVKPTSGTPVLGTIDFEGMKKSRDEEMKNSSNNREPVSEGKRLVMRTFTGQLEDGRVISGCNGYEVDGGDYSRRLDDNRKFLFIIV